MAVLNDATGDDNYYTPRRDLSWHVRAAERDAAGELGITEGDWDYAIAGSVNDPFQLGYARGRQEAASDARFFAIGASIFMLGVGGLIGAFFL